MSFRIEDMGVEQIDRCVGVEEKVEILQRLGEEETFHLVIGCLMDLMDITELSISSFCSAFTRLLRSTRHSPTMPYSALHRPYAAL